jgi:hypothetical protein
VRRVPSGAWRAKLHGDDAKEIITASTSMVQEGWHGTAPHRQGRQGEKMR